jgi:hypothetical protein
LYRTGFGHEKLGQRERAIFTKCALMRCKQQYVLRSKKGSMNKGLRSFCMGEFGGVARCVFITIKTLDQGGENLKGFGKDTMIEKGAEL